AAGARPQRGARRGGGRPAEPDPAADRLPLPPALPDRAAADVRGGRPDAHAGPRRPAARGGLPRRVDRGARGPHAGGRDRSALSGVVKGVHGRPSVGFHRSFLKLVDVASPPSIDQLKRAIRLRGTLRRQLVFCALFAAASLVLGLMERDTWTLAAAGV